MIIIPLESQSPVYGLFALLELSHVMLPQLRVEDRVIVRGFLEEVHPGILQPFSLDLKLSYPTDKLLILSMALQLLKETPHKYALSALYEAGSWC